MIKGMTGFGSTQFSHGKVKGTIELKSQNHRYLDIVYYLPAGFSAIENKIRQAISTNVKRGRVTVSIRITEKPLQEIVFNKEVIRTYLKNAKQLKKDFGVEEKLSLADLVQLPGVVLGKETILDPEDVWPSINRGFSRCLKSLVSMRTSEGKSLAADMLGIAKRMLLEINKIKSQKKTLLAAKKKAVLLEEFSSYQKSTDINEEISRLSHYVVEFKRLVKATAPVGKKMDFIAQEMQRETNTIGAKVQDKLVSNSVIALKSKIEKLREQAQNIE